MNDYEKVLLELEEMWAESAEYKFLPINISDEEYEKKMVMYKARRIYDMYGHEYLMRFIEENPHVNIDPEQLDPCRQEAGFPQCSLFCHNYDLIKGCKLNATE